MVSIFLHWLASEGCRSNSSVLLRACSKCQLISSESLGFENKRFKRVITGRYHMTMAGIFSLLSRIGSSVFYLGLGGIIFVFTIIIALVSAPLAHQASIIVFILLPV